MSTRQATPATTVNVQPPPAQQQSGRNADGKFAAGNHVGKGNPFARQCAASRKALVNAVTPQDIAEIAAKLLEKAKAGDAAAARVLFSYTLGKPAAAIDPDTINQQELQTLAANRADCVAAQRVVQLPSAEFMLELLHEMLPYFEKAIARKIHDMFMPSPDELEACKKCKQKEESGKAGARGTSAHGEPGASRAGGKRPETLEESLRRQRDQQETINKYLEPKKKARRSKKRGKPEHKARKQPVMPVGGRFQPSPNGGNGKMAHDRGD
jgi:hypothetical protein